VVVQQVRWGVVMMKIATHANPVRGPSFMLRASLDDIEGGGNYEQLWANGSARIGSRFAKDRCLSAIWRSAMWCDTSPSR